MDNRSANGNLIYPGLFLSNIAAACNATNEESKGPPKTEQELADARRAANRLSAKASRERKKAECDELARNSARLFKENTQLKRENAELRLQVDLLMKALNERTQVATNSYMANNSNNSNVAVANKCDVAVTPSPVPSPAIDDSNNNVVSSKTDLSLMNNDHLVATPTVAEAPISSSDGAPNVLQQPLNVSTGNIAFDDSDDDSTTILNLLMSEEDEEEIVGGVKKGNPTQEVGNEKLKEIEPEPLCNVFSNAKMKPMDKLSFDFESLFPKQHQVIMNNKADLFCGNTGPTQAAAKINSRFNSVGYHGKPNKKRARAA